MPDKMQNNQNDFIIEKVKQRPLDKKKLLRKTITTACMAVIFGSIACATFLLLEPIISERLAPEEKPIIVTFPEDREEMDPEDMLVEKSDEPEVQPTQPPEEIPVEVEEERPVILDRNNYGQIYSSMAEYVAELSKYMVTVTAVSSNRDWMDNVQENKNSVSGVMLIDNKVELLILTEASIIKKAEYLVVTFFEGTQCVATLKKQDLTTGLAMIAVPFADIPASLDRELLQYPTLGSSNNSNMLGMPVVAMGSPLETNSIGYGMITSESAIYSVPERNYKILRTDIIGSQSPNGVLFDLEGRVIGILTGGKLSSDVKNVVYAYGVTELNKLFARLANNIDIAYLGIYGITVPQEANKLQGVPNGAYVKSVDMDSPAMRSGMQPGDIITDVNGRNISTFNEYSNVLMNLTPGETATITVKRKSQDEYKEMVFTIETGVAK